MKFILLLLISSLFVSFVYSEGKPSVLVIKGTIFDHFPLYNGNFESTVGVADIIPGMVQSKIDLTTRTPIIASLDPTATQNVQGSLPLPDMFKYHFQSNQNAPLSKNSGANYPMPIDIVLNLNPDTGTYVLDNQKYYPIDYKGYDTDPSYRIYTPWNVYNNFHFCLKMNSRFTFNGGEVFNFIGDDDLWVFIDDKLVVDVGGAHPPRTKNIALNSLGLIVGKVYTFDLFYCERHTDSSTIKIETSIQAICPWYDYCGVCTGDGTTCCNPLTTCNDNNPCTIDKCPTPNQVIPPGQISSKCSHTYVACPVINKCTNNQCSTTNGLCVSTAIECPDRSSECLSLERCDPSNGCVYTQNCVGACLTGECLNPTGVGKGICEEKTNTTCSEELSFDICKVYSCDSRQGCKSSPKCPQNPLTPCEINKCNPLNGECTIDIQDPSECECGCEVELAANKCLLNNCENNSCEPKHVDKDDSNACTQDLCDPATGIISHIVNVTCPGCTKCNTQSGKCEAIDILCQDGNACTDNVCLESGICSNSTTSSCTGTDKCKNYNCDSVNGCFTTNVECPNEGNCKVGYCDSNVGCQVKPRECISPAFCIISECDESIGCISFDKVCPVGNSKCQKGVCRNATEEDEGECDEEDYDPLPFICKTAAVISTAVVAGVVVASVVGAAIIAFGSKKGYDYWKTTHGNSMSGSNSNPLYEQSKNNSENPLYIGNNGH